MSNEKNGGPVFPQSKYCGDMSITDGGINLRDYFAGQALSAIITNSIYASELMKSSGGSIGVARECYIFADSMIKARGDQDVV